jgi:hypothetical protein
VVEGEPISVLILIGAILLPAVAAGLIVTALALRLGSRERLAMRYIAPLARYRTTRSGRSGERPTSGRSRR